MAYLEARMSKQFMVLSKCCVGEIFESVGTYSSRTEETQEKTIADELQRNVK